LKYELNSAKGGVVVFSEIYYPGWKATLDGQNVEIGRADYVLRAVKVPAGKHQLEMTFSPSSIGVTETIAWLAMAILFVLLVVAIALKIRNESKESV
jgi:uncharacterized membrane protein YfhO